MMYLEKLSDKVWATKNARFLASKRMNRSRKSSTASVALLSASIIAVNMLAFFDGWQCYSTMITAVTIILSTFSLVMSLLITLLRYEYREDNYHQCALELAALNHRLELKISAINNVANNSVGNVVIPKDVNKQFLKDYDDILKKYNLNHTEFDYEYSKWKATKNSGCWGTFWYWLQWNVFDVYVVYWLIALIPLAWLAYIICK